MGGILTTLAAPAGLIITSLGKAGQLTVSNAFPNGVLSVEKAASPVGPWLQEKLICSLSSTAAVPVPLGPGAGFYRALAADVSGATNSWVFAPEEIINLDALASRLAAGNDPVSEKVGFQFSPATMDLLLAYPGGPDPALLRGQRSSPGGTFWRD